MFFQRLERSLFSVARRQPGIARGLTDGLSLCVAWFLSVVAPGDQFIERNPKHLRDTGQRCWPHASLAAALELGQPALINVSLNGESVLGQSTIGSKSANPCAEWFTL
ncbi:MAG TPA: hypothetical protein VJR92_11155 [Gemmatimonadaceae bacterium]|nr:hypothetical protein [Gemmatimonadaceae bacterium]